MSLYEPGTSAKHVDFPFPFIRRMPHFKLSGEHLNANFIKKATRVGGRHSSHSANPSLFLITRFLFFSSFLRLGVTIYKYSLGCPQIYSSLASAFRMPGYRFVGSSPVLLFPSCWRWGVGLSGRTRSHCVALSQCRPGWPLTDCDAPTFAFECEVQRHTPPPHLAFCCAS